MQIQHDRHPWNVRALLESTATPFTIAYYEPRAAIFCQGRPVPQLDAHRERSRVVGRDDAQRQGGEALGAGWV